MKRLVLLLSIALSATSGGLLTTSPDQVELHSVLFYSKFANSRSSNHINFAKLYLGESRSLLLKIAYCKLSIEEEGDKLAEMNPNCENWNILRLSRTSEMVFVTLRGPLGESQEFSIKSTASARLEVFSEGGIRTMDASSDSQEFIKASYMPYVGPYAKQFATPADLLSFSAGGRRPLATGGSALASGEARRVVADLPQRGAARRFVSADALAAPRRGFLSLPGMGATLSARGVGCRLLATVDLGVLEKAGTALNAALAKLLRRRFLDGVYVFVAGKPVEAEELAQAIREEMPEAMIVFEDEEGTVRFESAQPQLAEGAKGKELAVLGRLELGDQREKLIERAKKYREEGMSVRISGSAWREEGEGAVSTRKVEDKGDDLQSAQTVGGSEETKPVQSEGEFEEEVEVEGEGIDFTVPVEEDKGIKSTHSSSQISTTANPSSPSYPSLDTAEDSIWGRTGLREVRALPSSGFFSLEGLFTEDGRLDVAFDIFLQNQSDDLESRRVALRLEFFDDEGRLVGCADSRRGFESSRKCKLPPVAVAVKKGMLVQRVVVERQQVFRHAEKMFLGKLSVAVECKVNQHERKLSRKAQRLLEESPDASQNSLLSSNSTPKTSFPSQPRSTTVTQVKWTACPPPSWSISSFTGGFIFTLTTSLDQHLSRKSLTSFPFFTHFNAGLGRRFHLWGTPSGRAPRRLSDIDLAVRPTPRSQTIADFSFLRPQRQIVCRLDDRTAFFGTSSLHIAAVLGQNNYISQKLLRLGVEAPRMILEAAIKVDPSINEDFEYSIEVVAPDGLRVRRIFTQKSQNGWSVFRYKFSPAPSGAEIVFFARQKSGRNIPRAFEANIGKISVFEESFSEVESLANAVGFDYVVRRSFASSEDQPSFDLYVRAVLKPKNSEVSSASISRIILMRRGRFLKSLVFDTHVVRGIRLDKGQVAGEIIEAYALTELGEVVKQSATIVVDPEEAAPILMQTKGRAEGAEGN